MGTGTKKLKSVVAGFVAVGIVAVLAGTILSHADTGSAVSYLQGKSESSWRAMALVAALQSPSVDFLKSASASKAIDLEAPILAITATGKDAHTFPATDLVSELKGFYDGTQLGDATLLNDDIFGLLALTSAGIVQGDSVVTGVKSFVLNHQNADGGWSYAVSGTSDTNTTAAALMGLYGAGVPTSDTHVQSGLTYLKNAQNDDGGFPYDPKSSFGVSSDADSDSWILMAFNRLGIDGHTVSKNGKNVIDNLGTFQSPSGFYSYQGGTTEDSFVPITTSYAIIALNGKWLPVSVFSGSAASPTVHVTYRIEGQSQELCSGEADAVNAIDVLKTAQTACGISYTVKSMTFGDYVDSIGGEAASGQNGWLYAVNAVAPSVGAGVYPLKSADDVVWYWGDYQWKPTRLTLAASSVASGGSASASVQYFDSATWIALSGATVHAGSSTLTTDSSGTAAFTLADGAYRIFAEKSGFVRSNWSRVVVGAGNGTTLGLSVTVGGGSGSNNGGTPPTGGAAGPIGFSVTQTGGGSSLDFGTISAGAAVQKSVTIKNQGSVPIGLESQVTGDNLFKSFLLIDSKAWGLFRAHLATAESKTSQVGITLPTSFTMSGTKTGSLIFWATPEQ
jgi:Domain of unknown function (DUF4430)/Squalene-hopene cyclase C-terminal domain